MYIIDGYEGKPHITAPQVGDYNAGISGVESCVLNVGEKLRAESVDANTVRIYDGSFLFQGYRRGGIAAGTYEDAVIENGTQSQKRNDIIAIKYEKDGMAKTETVSIVVFKGTPGNAATDPAIPKGDIRAGDLVCYMPLYRVKLNDINVTGLDQLFVIRKSTANLESDMGNVAGLKTTAKTVVEAVNELDTDMSKRLMQSFTDPTQLGLVKNTCTLIDLYNALPAYGTIAYWITSTSAQIQSEIAAQLGTTVGNIFGTLSVTKHSGGVAIYTFYRYNGSTPEYIYKASYDLINAEAHWNDFVKLATVTDVNSLRLKSLIDRGNVTNTTESTNSGGYYNYAFNTPGAPNADAGVILAIPFGDLFTMKIAITSSNLVFTSVYVAGTSYGTWKQIS